MKFNWFAIVSAALVTCAQAVHLTNPTVGEATDVVWTVEPTDNETTTLWISLGPADNAFSVVQAWHIPDARAGQLSTVLDANITPGPDYALRVFEIRPDIFDWVREFSGSFELNPPATT
ncbi:hypothetical protein H1R20_g8872, partial [Candolleomyces eurysporus]